MSKDGNKDARVQQELIVELSFKRGSDKITAGRTAKGNNTLTGKLVWSDNLVVNNRRVEVGLDAEEAHGIKTIISIPNDADAFNVISKCNTIQASRTANAIGNKEPFVYAVIKTSGLIIFNQGYGSSENDVDRISVLDVSAAEIEINASCPSKAARPRIGVRAARVVQVAKSESFYDYWLRKQTEKQMVIDVLPSTIGVVLPSTIGDATGTKLSTSGLVDLDNLDEQSNTLQKAANLGNRASEEAANLAESPLGVSAVTPATVGAASSTTVGAVTPAQAAQEKIEAQAKEIADLKAMVQQLMAVTPATGALSPTKGGANKQNGQTAELVTQ